MAALLALALSGAVLGGCLAGERPPITTLYGDPLAGTVSGSGSGALVPVPGAVVSTESTTVVESAPSVFLDVPVPGGSLRYSNRPYLNDPHRAGYRRDRWRMPYGHAYPYADPPPRLRPGESRYIYPKNEIRCDNLVQGCYRWSGRQGAFIADQDETRALYGERAIRRGFPTRQR